MFGLLGSLNYYSGYRKTGDKDSHYQHWQSFVSRICLVSHDCKSLLELRVELHFSPQLMAIFDNIKILMIIFVVQYDFDMCIHEVVVHISCKFS